MLTGASYPKLQKPELFNLLRRGHSAAIVVVTPNRRLALELSREFDQSQFAAELPAWETADILPFQSFVERLYEDALYSGGDHALPQLLTASQEQELWRSVIRTSAWGDSLLALAQTAADCRDAWMKAHQWRIDGALGQFPGGEDAAAFAEWAKEYARRCERQNLTDAARLTDAAAALLATASLRRPRVLVVHTWDVIPPQIRLFLHACAQHGIDLRESGPVALRGRTIRTALGSRREELHAAACWARSRVQDGCARIGVVVPELAARRKEVARVFGRVMDPGGMLPGAPARTLPFNISLGAPLDQYPVVRAALGLLELAGGEFTFEHASKLLRSPFIPGAETEMAQRARLDARLRRTAPARLTLAKLVALIEGCPALRESLEALLAAAREMARVDRPPHDWARQFSGLLAAAGHPGERDLDSAEFQARAKFNDTLAEFARLERVVPKLSFDAALARLRRLCGEELFQPESPQAPVQILGVLESAGLEFDGLWVSGLTDDAWPLPARPNPFLPHALQRKAGIPEASPEETLARARRITAGWLAAAPEVVVSHSLHEEDRELIVSPLIASLPEGTLDTHITATADTLRERIHAARRLEVVADGRAAPLATRSPRGGTRILSDQAACPFRAFARHRLAAEALESPADGLDARDRGSLLHALMKELWSQLKGSAGLQGDCEAAIARAAQVAVRDAQIEEPFAGLERRRLARLARDWLAVERERPPFEVVATEQKRKLLAGGLELAGRIDRMDRLHGGGHALIDYKTGKPSPKEWLGDRPDDPQLPLYALNAGEDIVAVMFAKLRKGSMRYMGFSASDGLVPEVKPAENWPALLSEWKKQVETLGMAFGAGDARVDPKRLLQTCRYCDLQALCRVYERVNTLSEGEEESTDD